MQGTENAVLLNVRIRKGPQGKNYNLYLFLLLGHLKRAHVQVAVDCLVLRQAKLPKETGRRYKDIICKD